MIALGEIYSFFFPIGNEVHVDTHTHGSMVVSKNDRSQYIPEQQRTSVVFFHLYFFLFFFSPSIIVYYCYLHWSSSLLWTFCDVLFEPLAAEVAGDDHSIQSTSLNKKQGFLMIAKIYEFLCFKLTGTWRGGGAITWSCIGTADWCCWW